MRRWLLPFSFLLGGLALGILISTLRQPPGGANDLYRQRYEALESKIHGLEEGDLKDYVHLKKAEERYKKADEILGKVLLALLVDAGIRIRPELATQFTQLKDAQDPGKTPQPAELRVRQTEVLVPSPAAGVAPESSLPARAWARNEKLLSNVSASSSDEQTRAFLDQVLIPDLYAELHSLKVLDANRLAQLNGAFAGEIVFDDKNKSPWQLELSVAGAMEQDKARGSLELKVWENGRLASHNTQSGLFHGYSRLGDDSAALLAEIEKDRGLMQLYSVPQADRLIGNFYVKGEPGGYKRVGTVLLRRR